MIPVVVCPTLLRRPDLLERLLASFDHPVQRLVFVVNDLSDWRWEGSGPFERVEYIRPVVGLGNHGGINAGIAQTPQAKWWLWVNDDIAFGPGDLGDIVAMVEDGDDPVVVTGDRADSRYLMFCYGAINRAAFERVGPVDEWTFYPIYYGDNDYLYRAKLAGVEWVEFNGAILHGDDGMTASNTFKADHRLQQRNVLTSEANRRAYIEKWGGPPDRETYRTPWALDVPLDWTRIDIAKRAERIW